MIYLQEAHKMRALCGGRARLCVSSPELLAGFLSNVILRARTKFIDQINFAPYLSNTCIHIYVHTYISYVKVKQLLCGPGQAPNFPGARGSQISRQSAHEGRKVVSLTLRPPLPTRKYSWYSFMLEAESTPGLQCGRKDYVNEKL